MATLKEKIKINDLYLRTTNNIGYYQDHEMWEHLLNEIGVLRGIIYCMEELDKKEFINYRKYFKENDLWQKQEHMLYEENQANIKKIKEEQTKWAK